MFTTSYACLFAISIHMVLILYAVCTFLFLRDIKFFICVCYEINMRSKYFLYV
uniref:Uncharacterized protein n=1 Tax=Aegilops tauschii subsp. strangulata TaxID=200361 RepID=A0A453TEE1_AEGTS